MSLTTLTIAVILAAGTCVLIALIAARKGGLSASGAGIAIIGVLTAMALALLYVSSLRSDY